MTQKIEKIDKKEERVINLLFEKHGTKVWKLNTIKHEYTTTYYFSNIENGYRTVISGAPKPILEIYNKENICIFVSTNDIIKKLYDMISNQYIHKMDNDLSEYESMITGFKENDNINFCTV